MSRILVTGANGFVGRRLCDVLRRHGHVVRPALRGLDGATTNGHVAPHAAEAVAVGELTPETDWGKALAGIDVVIHLAARVHVMHDAADSLAQFRRVNTAATEHLARSAAASGAKRLVYVSSIKVNGEATHAGARFSEVDQPAPLDSYGVSKWEAEQALHAVSAETGLEVVIVRPPLVYGPGVKGNFAQMLGVIGKGLPLPLASVHNRRSLVYVENLADALAACATHPHAAGQTYLVADGEDVSTPELLRTLAVGMRKRLRLLPCPPALLRAAAAMFGKGAAADRLLGSLQVNSGKIRRELNWVPPFSLQQGLRATAEWYRNKDR